VVRAQEEIQLVLDQFTENPTDRVDGIIHYEGRTHVVPESTLRDKTMRAMCGSPLAGNFGYSYEYEPPQVTWLPSREVLILHGLLEYINGDRDSNFSVTVWKEPNKIAETMLIPSTRFPPYVSILGTWLNLTPMAPQKLAGIGSGGLPIR
jgi:hypothetical protein